MAGSSIKAGEAYVKVGVRDEATKALQRLQGRLNAVGAGFTKVGAAVSAGGAAILTPLLGAVTATVEMGSAMADMSARTGVSVESLSELSYAAQVSAVEAGALEGGLTKMHKAVAEAGEGSKAAVAKFNDLGISIEELQSLTPDKQFELIASKIAAIENPAQRTAAAMSIFGKSGAGLLPLLREGGAGIDALRKQANELGLTMSGEDASAAEALGDQLDTLWAVVKMGTFNIGAALVPTISDLVSGIVKVTAWIGDWIKTNRDLFLTIAKVAVGLVAAGGALVTIGLLFSAMAAGIGGLLAVASGVGTVIAGIGTVIGFLVSPIGLVLVGLTAAAGAFLYFSGVGGKAIAYIRDQFSTLAAIATSTFQGVSDAFQSGNLGLAAQIAWLGVKMAFAAGTADALGIVDGFVQNALDTFVWFRARVGEIAVGIVKFFADRFGGLMDTLLQWAITAAEIFAGFKSIVFGTDISAEIANLQKLKGMSASQVAELAGQGVAQQEESGFAANQRSREEKGQARQAAADAARKELASLVQQAAREAAGKAVEAKKPESTPDSPDIEKLKKQAEKSSGKDAVQERTVESSGTFSSAAAARLGNGGNHLSQIEQNTKESAKQAKRTAEGLFRLQFGLPALNQ